MQSNALNNKLEQYSSVAKSQAAHGKSVAELVGYAAAAGASLAMAGGADAAIIYTGVENVSVQISSVALATGSANSNGTLPQPQSSKSTSNTTGQAALSSGSVVASTTSPATTKSGTFLTSSHANTGQTGSVNTYQTSQGGQATGVSVGIASKTSAGTVPPSVASVGFKPGNIDYRWISLVADDSTMSPMLFDMAMPVAADSATIHTQITGQTTVSEPSSLALLAAGAAGVSAFRRRKAAKPAH